MRPVPPVYLFPDPADPFQLAYLQKVYRVVTWIQGPLILQVVAWKTDSMIALACPTRRLEKRLASFEPGHEIGFEACRLAPRQIGFVD